MKNIAIVFAGGTGQRMGAGLPKQFIEVYGKPIIIHTLDIFEECGIDPTFYANRRREFDEVLPWDHINYGVTKEFLIKECKKAYANATTEHCRLKCNNCGAAKYGEGVCFEKRKNLV